MLPIEFMRTGLPHEFATGTVVAYRKDETYAFGMVVKSERKDVVPGVLHLGFSNQATEIPYFDHSAGSCVCVVPKPVWQWSGDLSALHSLRRGYPKPGYLVIDGTTRLINGLATGSHNEVVHRYWDLATGDMVMNHPGLDTAVFILHWQMGMVDIEGKLKTLVDFKVQETP